jgi:RNA polymerase sigma factor (sigma-70 family)
MADIYHTSYRRLVAQVYAFTTDLGEAQDAVQEAFARALARGNALADVDAPEAWLRTVAINIVRRRWRRRQLLNAILLRERPLARVVEEAPSPANADLREALANIPRAYREVIVLHYLADLPVDEVATILEVPVGTVKSRLSRGREALKGLLDDVEAPPLDQVKQRAKTIRTRRRVAQAGAALAVVLVSTVLFVPFDPQTTVPPAESPPPVLSYGGSGLTLRSVPEVETVPDLPGKITEFDVDGAGVLLTDEGTWARSSDGGQTWEITDYQRQGAQKSPAYWQSPRPTPSGVWWRGGFEDGRLVVAHSRSGRDDDWTEMRLNPTEAGNLTATLDGEKLLVFQLNSRDIAEALLGDANGFRSVSYGGGMTILGEPIVLPDGRWLVNDAESRWQLSSDGGRTWSPAGGNVPVAGGLYMTSKGYVALDVFRAGWVAVSPDGVSWQKLPIR